MYGGELGLKEIISRKYEETAYKGVNTFSRLLERGAELYRGFLEDFNSPDPLEALNAVTGKLRKQTEDLGEGIEGMSGQVGKVNEGIKEGRRQAKDLGEKVRIFNHKPGGEDFDFSTEGQRAFYQKNSDFRAYVTSRPKEIIPEEVKGKILEDLDREVREFERIRSGYLN